MKKIVPTLFFVLLSLSMAGESNAYRVSGLVDFSYRFYETKVGRDIARDEYFAQTYSAGISHYLFDRRILKYSADISYSDINAKNSAGTKGLGYGVQMQLFPNMLVSTNLFANKTINRIQSSNDISGTEIISTGYGAHVYVALSRMGSSGGMGKNNNNNSGRNRNNSNDDDLGDNEGNNNRSSRKGTITRFVLPDISLSHSHTDSENRNVLSPYHTVSDNSRGQLYLRPSSRLDVTLGAGILKNKDTVDGTSYQDRSYTLNSGYKISDTTQLGMNGSKSDTSNIGYLGFMSHSEKSNYNIMLHVRSNPKLAHSYSYSYLEQKSSDAKSRSQNGNGQVYYNVWDNLKVNGMLGKTRDEYVTYANLIQPEHTGIMDVTSAQAGAQYDKQVTPDLLKPFALFGGYGISWGYANTQYSTAADSNAVATANGFYYVHNVGLVLSSVDWQQETLSLSYNFNARRDHSSIPLDSDVESVRLAFTTRRIVRTNVQASYEYSERETLTVVVSPIFTAQSNYQKGHANTYNIAIDHRATDDLSLSAGATRAKSTTSTVNEQIGSFFASMDQRSWTFNELVYAAANYSHALGSRSRYRATFRNENARTPSARTQSNDLAMYLDYRLNQIFVGLEYRWREDKQSNSTRVLQQMLFARVSRPF